MLNFLVDGMLPAQMRVDQKRKFILKSRPFLIIAESLYQRGIDQIIRRCVSEEEQEVVLREAHNGDAGGHFSGEITRRKIMQAGLWWPFVLRDAHKYSKECLQCQKWDSRVHQIEWQIILFCLLNHFKNGDWILWVQ